MIQINPLIFIDPLIEMNGKIALVVWFCFYLWNVFIKILGLHEQL
jgi:hypothetical protein